VHRPLGEQSQDGGADVATAGAGTAATATAPLAAAELGAAMARIPAASGILVLVSAVHR